MAEATAVEGVEEDKEEEEGICCARHTDPAVPLSLSLSLPWRSWPRPPSHNNTRKCWFSYGSAALAFPTRLKQEGRREGGKKGRREGRKNGQRR